MTKERRGYSYPLFVIIEEDWMKERRIEIGIRIRIKGERNEGKIGQINTNEYGDKKNNKIIVKNNIIW